MSSTDRNASFHIPNCELASSCWNRMSNKISCVSLEFKSGRSRWSLYFKRLLRCERKFSHKRLNSEFLLYLTQKLKASIATNWYNASILLLFRKTSKQFLYVSQRNLNHGVGDSTLSSASNSSGVIVYAFNMTCSGVCSNSKSATCINSSVEPPAATIASSTFFVANSRNFFRTSSKLCTFTCWQAMRYWINPSLANRPFFKSTHNSTYLNMISSKGFDHVRCLRDVTTSCNACSADKGCPTLMSSSCYVRKEKMKNVVSFCAF